MFPFWIDLTPVTAAEAVSLFVGTIVVLQLFFVGAD